MIIAPINQGVHELGLHDKYKYFEELKNNIDTLFSLRFKSIDAIALHCLNYPAKNYELDFGLQFLQCRILMYYAIGNWVDLLRDDVEN